MDAVIESNPLASSTKFELTLRREDLLKPLQQISSTIDRKQTLPILSTILFRIKDNALTLIGTDLEVELIKTIQLGDPTADAEVAIPAKKLNDICKALPSDAMLNLVRQKNQMVLTSGKSRFVLSLLSATDFPTVEKTGDDQLTVPVIASQLRRLFEKTHFAMALQDIRYFLNGLLLDIQGSRCTAVATDGHRLASMSMELTQSFPERKQVLVPRKAVLELIKLLHMDEEDLLVDVHVGENYISVQCKEFQFTSKLIDGLFPQYQSLIPSHCDKQVLVGKQAFKDALSRVAILSNEKYRGAWMTFADSKVVLRANNPDRDQAEEELAVDMQGTEVKIGCNVNYILDVLAVLDGDQVELKMNDGNSSLLLVSPGSDDGEYVVMPMCL
jgi:DNA polymerase-3 subunit beta